MRTADLRMVYTTGQNRDADAHKTVTLTLTLTRILILTVNVNPILFVVYTIRISSDLQFAFYRSLPLPSNNTGNSLQERTASMDYSWLYALRDP